MPPKENLERACEECIHFFACARQCGEPMAQRSATGCECYETVKSSMAYYVGTLDGAKGKIPNRLRELAEADEDIYKYLGTEHGYGMQIDDLKIYDTPRELGEFTGLRTTKDGFELSLITRPPQSWRYVEELP